MEPVTRLFYTMGGWIHWVLEVDFMSFADARTGDRSIEFIDEKVLNS